MDINKIMNDFKSIKDKVDTYEKEHNNVLTLIKNINKEIKKLESKKETDPIDKAITKLKISINKEFINTLNGIFICSTPKEDKANGK